MELFVYGNASHLVLSMIRLRARMLAFSFARESNRLWERGERKRIRVDPSSLSMNEGEQSFFFSFIICFDQSLRIRGCTYLSLDRSMNDQVHRFSSSSSSFSLVCSCSLTDFFFSPVVLDFFRIVSMTNNGESSKEPRARLCHLRRWPNFVGYGFNLHCEKSKPGQFIGKVDPDSPAESAGLCEYDRIIEVNYVPIGNENHKQVVSRIKEGVTRNGTKYPEEVILLVLDPEADGYYKNKSIVVRSSDPNVDKHETEIRDGTGLILPGILFSAFSLICS